MTKVLIMSDSHGLTAEIKKIKERHQLEHMIHCGDSELEMDAGVLKSLVTVGGNCDYGTGYPDDQTIQIQGITFFITHGHLYNVQKDLMILSYRAAEQNAQIVCYGHTHVARVEEIGNTIFINPGSIRLPRDRAEKTYAIIELTPFATVQVDFYTTNGELVDELAYTGSLLNV